MRHNLRELIGYTITATDGEIGKVEEIYFDDSSWTVRYLVVDTGGWLSGRKVLLTPAAVGDVDASNRTYLVNLTREQVESSPDINTEKPVSRQHEIDLYEHYGWPFNNLAGPNFYGGIGMTGMTETRVPFTESIAERNRDEDTEDPHLRSSAEVKGYDIHAKDGEFGKVEDFILDSDWRIRYLVIDSGGWFSGKKLLMSPRWITDVSWEDSKVYVDIPVEMIKSSPEYDESAGPVHPMYEQGLHQHYGKDYE